MLSYCTDDILWTGAEQKEYIMGIEAVRKNFTELMSVIQPCIISNGEFIVVQNTGNACTVSGRYLVETLPEAGYFLQAEQRCTFVWERINDEPRIRHMHVSNRCKITRY
jgi:ketosteroid isomerase-like protein